MFSLTTAGKEKVIYAFKGGADGISPNGLTKVGSLLYGTTYQGGGTGCQGDGNISGCGTVFSVTKAGEEQVVYAFQNPPDASFPEAGLIDAGGTLYGTGGQGGSGPDGNGAVFSVTPAGAESVVYSFSVDNANCSL